MNYKHMQRVSFDWYCPTEGIVHHDSIDFAFRSSCKGDRDMDFAYGIFMNKLTKFFVARRLSLFSVFFHLTSWSKCVEISK